MVAINIAQWSWPQWIVILWLCSGLMTGAILHGKPKVDDRTGDPLTYSFQVAFVRAIVTALVLILGGFWGHQ